jgi:hypothetical protein
VIYSHSCMRSIWDHPRNISDDQARACAATRGVIGITGVGIFLGPNSRTLEAMTRHLQYAVDDVGRVGLERVDRQRAHPRMPRPFANALVLDRLVIEQRWEEAYQAGQRNTNLMPAANTTEDIVELQLWRWADRQLEEE